MEWYYVLLIVIVCIITWFLLSVFFYKLFFKRFYDIICALATLIVFGWLYLIIAILVKIKLGSPIIYKTTRTGKSGKSFELYKFRSMTDEKDKNGELLPDIFRLTKFGRILRSSSLDELPEVVNILKGDMSIIGPRPLPPVYLSYYTKKENHRHDMRPGLSGWAQVNGRNSIKWDVKFKYDIEYVHNVSLIFDLKILFMTVCKVFKREGIGQGEERPGNLNDIRAEWLDENGNIKPKYQDDGQI